MIIVGSTALEKWGLNRASQLLEDADFFKEVLEKL